MTISEGLNFDDIDQVMPVSARDLDDSDMIVALMGATGTGKSTFVQTVAGDRFQTEEIGHQLRSATSDVQALRITFKCGDNRNLVLVDTPGFDDTHKTDFQILEAIVRWLNNARTKNSGRYGLLRKISGILFLHRITDIRVRGSVTKNLILFQKLCGEDFYSRVILTTTMWPDKDDPSYDCMDEIDCWAREEDLKKKFWKSMIDTGSKVQRFTGTSESAQEIINVIVSRNYKDQELPEMQIQKEIGRESKSLLDTRVGQYLSRLLKFGNHMPKHAPATKRMHGGN